MSVDGELASHCVSMAGKKGTCPITSDMDLMRTVHPACEGLSIVATFEGWLDEIGEELNDDTPMKMKRYHRLQGQLVVLTNVIAFAKNPYNPDVPAVLAEAQARLERE